MPIFLWMIFPCAVWGGWWSVMAQEVTEQVTEQVTDQIMEPRGSDACEPGARRSAG